MTQVLVRADNGQLACIAEDDHVWGRRECWPSFVVLRVPQAAAAVRQAAEQAQGEALRLYVDLDELTDAENYALADDDAANTGPIPFTTSPSACAKLSAATTYRNIEKAAFVVWGLVEKDDPSKAMFTEALAVTKAAARAAKPIRPTGQGGGPKGEVIRGR